MKIAVYIITKIQFVLLRISENTISNVANHFKTAQNTSSIKYILGYYILQIRQTLQRKSDFKCRYTNNTCFINISLNSLLFSDMERILGNNIHNKIIYIIPENANTRYIYKKHNKMRSCVGI